MFPLSCIDFGIFHGQCSQNKRLSDAFTTSQCDHSGDKRIPRREDGKYITYIWIFRGPDRALIIILFP